MSFLSSADDVLGVLAGAEVLLECGTLEKCKVAWNCEYKLNQTGI